MFLENNSASRSGLSRPAAPMPSFIFLTLVANLTNETSERFGSGEVICSSLANEKMLGQHFASAANYKLQSGSNHRNRP